MKRKKIKDLTDKEKQLICKKALSEPNYARSLYNGLSNCNIFCPLVTPTGFCMGKRSVYDDEEIEVEEV